MRHRLIIRENGEPWTECEWDRMLLSQMCETMTATLRGWEYEYVPRATIMEWVRAQGQ